MLLEQKIKVKWNNKYKYYYESKGYKFTKLNEEFEVDIKDLSLGSHSIIKYKCDYCNNIYESSFIAYNRKFKYDTIQLDCCQKCQPLKRKETMNLRYGVDYALQNKDIKDKMKKTCLEKYGVEHAFQSKEIQQKMQKTMIEKYGVKHSMLLDETKEKIKKTNLEKYGVECSCQREDIRQKVKNNNLEKYGVECALQAKIIREKVKQNNLTKYGVEYVSQNEDEMKKILKKINISTHKNGTAVCTIPQKYIYKLLNNIQKCELNYPVENCSLDIAYPEKMIYIEYDGGGHNKRVKCNWQTTEEFNKKEIYRQYYLKNKGWKLIRIISDKDKLPEDNKLIELIDECKNYLLNTDHTWIKINIDENKIECKEYIKNINFIKLRKIKKEDLI